MPVADLLPNSGYPYVTVMAIGFLLGAWGHGMRSRTLVAIGIALIIVSVLLFQVALNVFSDSGGSPPPPVP